MAKDTGTAEAKKPEADDDVTFVGAAANMDAPDNRKDAKAEQPVFQENPAHAEEEEEEENAKKKKNDFGFEQPQDNFSDKNAADDNDAAPEEQEELPLRIGRKNMELLNEVWGIPAITRALDETLENAKINHNSTTGVLDFSLANGSRVQYIPNHNGVQGFVGFTNKKKLDDLDAKMIIATLASQGRKEVNLFGDRESKEKMWLEAMRQGLTVTNFQPLPSDDPNSVYQKWLREAQDLQTGAAADPRFPAQESKIEPPGEEAPETAEVETPTAPAAETAEAETPAAPAAETTEAETPTAPATETAEAETPAAPAAETAEAEAPAAPAAETPAAEKPTAVKSSFLTEQPAPQEKAAEAPAAEAANAEETPAAEKPAAVKSSFLGEGKKDEAPAPKGPEMPKNESFEETLDRRIKQTENLEIKAALHTLKADYKSGALKLDDIDREIVQRKLGGNKPLTPSKVNAAIDHVAKKPGNEDAILPKVADEQKPQKTARHRGPAR